MDFRVIRLDYLKLLINYQQQVKKKFTLGDILYSYLNIIV